MPSSRVTMIAVRPHPRSFRAVAAGLCALAWALPALALQAPPPLPPTPPPPQPMVLVPPPAAIQFQRSVQQQQLRDQLQQRQLESELRRNVSEQSRAPLDPASRNRAQLEQAEQAQRARDQAAQQSLLDQYQGAGMQPPTSRVQPARARSGQE